MGQDEPEIAFAASLDTTVVEFRETRPSSHELVRPNLDHGRVQRRPQHRVAAAIPVFEVQRQRQGILVDLMAEHELVDLVARERFGQQSVVADRSRRADHDGRIFGAPLELAGVVERHSQLHRDSTRETGRLARLGVGLFEDLDRLDVVVALVGQGAQQDERFGALADQVRDRLRRPPTALWHDRDRRRRNGRERLGLAERRLEP